MRLKTETALITGAVHEYAQPGKAIRRSDALLSADEEASAPHYPEQMGA
jgi:hypothetical protein